MQAAAKLKKTEPKLAEAIAGLDPKAKIDDQLKQFKKLQSFATAEVHDEHGRTPLISAIITMNSDALKWLGEQKKDLGWDLRDSKEQKTAVMHAFDCSSYDDKKSDDVIEAKRVAIAEYVLSMISKLPFEQRMRHSNEAMDFVARKKISFGFDEPLLKEKANDNLAIAFLQNVFTQALRYGHFELAEQALDLFSYAKKGTYSNHPQNVNAVFIAMESKAFALATKLIKEGFPMQSEQRGSALTCLLTLRNKYATKYVLSRMSHHKLEKNVIEYRWESGYGISYRVIGLDNHEKKGVIGRNQLPSNFAEWQIERSNDLMLAIAKTGCIFPSQACYSVFGALKEREVKISNDDVKLILQIRDIGDRRDLFFQFNLIQFSVNDVFNIWKEIGGKSYYHLVMSIPLDVDCTKYLTFAIEQFVAGNDQQDMLNTARINDLSCKLAHLALAAKAKDLSMVQALLEIRVGRDEQGQGGSSPLQGEQVWQVLNVMLQSCLEIKEEPQRQAYLQDAYQIFKELKNLFPVTIKQQDWELAIRIGSEELLFNLLELLMVNNYQTLLDFFTLVVQKGDINLINWTINNVAIYRWTIHNMFIYYGYLDIAFEHKNLLILKKLLSLNVDYASDGKLSNFILKVLDFYHKDKNQIPQADMLAILELLDNKKVKFAFDILKKAVAIDDELIIEKIISSVHVQEHLQEFLSLVLFVGMPLPIIERIVSQGAKIELQHWKMVISNDVKAEPRFNTLLKLSPGLKNQDVLNYAVKTYAVTAVKKLLEHAPWEPDEIERAKQSLWAQESKEFSEERTRIVKILKFYPWQLTASDYLAGSEFSQMDQADREFILGLKGNTTAGTEEANEPASPKLHKDAKEESQPNTAPPSAPPMENEVQQEGVPNPNIASPVSPKQQRFSSPQALFPSNPIDIYMRSVLQAQLALMPALQQIPEGADLFKQVEAFCNQKLKNLNDLQKQQAFKKR